MSTIDNQVNSQIFGGAAGIAARRARIAARTARMTTSIGSSTGAPPSSMFRPKASSDNSYNEIIATIAVESGSETVKRKDGKFMAKVGKAWKDFDEVYKDGNKCHALGLDSGKTNPLACERLLVTLAGLMSSDNFSCGSFLKDGTIVTLLGKDPVNELNDANDQILPQAAFALLKGLGFKGKEKGKLHVLESIAEWEDRLNKKEMTDDNEKPITINDAAVAAAKGSNGIKLITLMHQYVNANPAILNAGYNHESTDDKTSNSLGLSSPVSDPVVADLNDLRSLADSVLGAVDFDISTTLGALGFAPHIGIPDSGDTYIGVFFHRGLSI